MSFYWIRPGDAPSEIAVNNGVATNNGPSVVYYADSDGVSPTSYEGLIAVGDTVALEGAQWFMTVGARTQLTVLPGPDTFGQGSPGQPGPPGLDATASDALRGQVDRFNSDVGGVLVYNGSGFAVKNDEVSRPQNIDLVTTDVAGITVLHESIDPRALVSSRADAGPNLDAIGVRAIANTSTDLLSTVVTLHQTRTLADAISYNGSSWVKELGTTGSPFTATFASNKLHLVHADAGSARVADIRVTGTGLLRPVLDASSVTATSFDVKFYDATNTQVTSASTDMAVSVSRMVDRVLDPTDLVVDVVVQKDQAWVDLLALMPNKKLWWRLGEPSGLSFNDEIGTNDGTGTATLTPGVAGSVSGDANTAVTFDGTQGKIAGVSPGLIGPWSFFALFKCTGAGSVGNTEYGTILGLSSSRRLLIHHADGIVRAEFGVALTTPAATAPTNSWNSVLLTWDGTTLRLIVNGILQSEAVTAGITFNAAFWLGSYLATSTNYSFKGSMDEPIIFDRALTMAEAQQLHVTAFNSVVVADRSLQSSLAFRGWFETFAPPPPDEPEQPAPTATALPVGDAGGAATSYASLAPYRSILNAFNGWVGRALPALQVNRDPILLNGLPGLAAATSANWKDWFCVQFGIDSVTGATTGNGLSGTSQPLYLNVARHFIYVVGADQPLRPMFDNDTSFAGWASQFNAAEASLGGLALPADALPDFTGDRYTILFQPSADLFATIYAHQPSPTDRATTTLELTSAPSNGGFFLEFDYMDNVNQAMNTYFSQTPVPYNCTSSQMQSLIFAAKRSDGQALGSLRANSTPVLCSGGPLNVAPIVCSWVLGAPLQPVGMRYTNNFMNAGGVHFTYKNADTWSWSRLSAITSPGVTGGHVPTISGAPAVATATRIDQLPLIIDWNEYKTAFDAAVAAGDGTIAGADWDAPGTDLGHVIGMSIGNAGTGFVYPATAGDGTLANTDGSKMKQGALCTFPVAADFSRVAPEMMPLANTIKRYGFVPYDKTGFGSEFVFRSWSWPAQSRPFPGPPTFNVSQTQQRVAYMRQLPWHQMQIIDPATVLAGW